MKHEFRLAEHSLLSTQVYHVRSERASLRQIDGPGGFDDAQDNSTGYSVLDRCDVPATEANAAACGGHWRPREYEYWGIELAGRIDFGTVLATVHNVYVLGSYTNLVVARFKKDGFDPTDGITRGDRLPYAPRHLASISLGYQQPRDVDARIGVDHVSRQQPDTFARVLPPVDAALSGLSGDIPAYTLINASITYRPRGGNATYFLSGHNLTDRKYLVSRVDGMVAGRQRQIFGGVRYEF